MFRGGQTNKRTAKTVIKYAEFFSPIILFTYGILVQNGIIKSSYAIDSFWFYVILITWFILGACQLLFPSKSKDFLGFRIIIYHILVSLYLLFISGFASPMTSVWCVMVVFSYISYLKIGAIISSLAFLLVAITDTAINNFNQLSISNNTFTFFVIMISCLICISFFQTEKVNQLTITNSKANEQLQKDSLITLINSLTDAILSIDKHGIVRVYNSASLDLLDTNQSLNGKHIDDIVPLINKNNESVSIFKESQEIKSIVKHDDFSFISSTNEKVRLEITYSPIHSTYIQNTKSTNIDGYVVIMRDITKQKSLEEERDEFISVTSHELRTPITIAEGAISNLQIMLTHPDITQKMLKDSVNTAHDQIIFLANMVNDLSTLSRAERNVNNKTELIDIEELAHKLHDRYINEASSKKLHLNLDIAHDLGSVEVNRLYLEELLQNFLTNSIKYTKRGSIDIIFKRVDDNVLFSVKDTGIGISKSDQAKIYNKFYRSEDYRTRETGGTGLGLYIAQKLANRLNTKIELNSRLNFGSTFSFLLPIKKQDK